MSHLSQDDLVLLHYDERPVTDAAREHLESCPHCRAEQATLAVLLRSIEAPQAPERDAAYEERVWRKLTARLGQESTRPAWLSWLSFPLTGRRLATAGAVVGLAVLAYWAGRVRGQSEIALSSVQRERILFAAVSEHLERSERVLRELVNTAPAPTTDLGLGPQSAARLAEDNRIYRATALHAGEVRLAQLLDELERVLVEIANSPQNVSGPEFNILWRRIQANGLLIKMRIAESETRRDAQNRPPTHTNHI